MKSVKFISPVKIKINWMQKALIAQKKSFGHPLAGGLPDPLSTLAISIRWTFNIFLFKKNKGYFATSKIHFPMKKSPFPNNPSVGLDI